VKVKGTDVAHSLIFLRIGSGDPFLIPPRGAGADEQHRSRDTFACPSLADHQANGFAPGDKREGKRRKTQCRPLPRCTNKRCRLLMLRARLRASQTSVRGLRTHPLPGRARLPALRPRLSPGTLTSLTQLQAMLPGIQNQAGVTRPFLSQSSDSTSRLGRSTEGNDAQSRPGAGCKPARRHRTRSASESALAKASLDERVIHTVTKTETTVKSRHQIGYQRPADDVLNAGHQSRPMVNRTRGRNTPRSAQCPTDTKRRFIRQHGRAPTTRRRLVGRTARRGDVACFVHSRHQHNEVEPLAAAGIAVTSYRGDRHRHSFCRIGDSGVARVLRQQTIPSSEGTGG
jgi:hypothetical protein